MKVWFVLLVCGLALATAARYEDDDIDDLDDIDPDEEPSSGLIARLKSGLQRALDRLKPRLERNKELAAEFGDKVKEISKNILELGKETGKKTLDKIRVLNRKIRDLTRDILRRGGLAIHKRDVSADLLRIMKEIKSLILKPDGYHEFKQHIMNLKTDHPILEMLKSYIEAGDDKDLYEILEALLSGIPSFYKARRATTRLEQLFRELAEILKTPEGFNKVYDYFVDLQTDHPLVSRFQILLQTVDKDMVRDILTELIESLE